MKKIFILFAVIGCLAISFTTGIFGNTESVIDDIDGLIRQYEEAGALSKDTSHDEVTIATATARISAFPIAKAKSTVALLWTWPTHGKRPYII